MGMVFDRLQGDVTDANGVVRRKIPVHPFYTSLMLYSRGHMTPAQIQTLFDLDASDFAAGSDIADLLELSQSIIDPGDDRDFGRDIWAMMCTMEWDIDNITGLRDRATFYAKATALRDMYNSGA